MKTLSLCMIVKNEEEVLDNCLSSISDIVDEIIIIDTGSIDKTKEIANKYNSKVYDFQWIDDFSAARNYSFSKATCDYILWLDADDVLIDDDRKKLKELKENLDKKYDAVSMFYNYAFDEDGNVILRFRRNRIVKRKRKYKWCGFVHEYIDVKGKILNSDISITHKRVHDAGERNLNIYKSKIMKGYGLTSRDKYYYAKELFDNMLYTEGIKIFNEYLDENKGWIEDNIVACGKIADYYFSVKKYREGRRYCFRTFEYDLPRGEICCKLGLSYINQKNYKDAIFWYELATRLEKPVNDWGFINDSTYTWLPHIQLCVCYYKLGNVDKSYEHNKLAANYNSDNESIKYNEEFFRELGYE